MRVQVESGNTRSFIAFAQARSFLAVRRARGSVEVSPLITWSASADERRVATMLTDACEDLLAFTHFPLAHWRKIWSTNPLERLNGEIKRRTNVVGIFLRVSLVVGEELGVTRNLSVEPSALTLLGPVPSAPSEWSSDLIAA